MRMKNHPLNLTAIALIAFVLLGITGCGFSVGDAVSAGAYDFVTESVNAILANLFPLADAVPSAR